MAAWLAAALAGVLATGPLFDRLSDSGVPKSVESIAGNEVLSEGNESAGTVLAVIDGVDPDSSRVRDAVNAVAAEVAGVPGVDNVAHPFDPNLSPQEAAPLRSSDGRAVLMSVRLTNLGRPERDTAATAIQARLRALPGNLPPGATVEVGGSPVLSMQARAAVQDDLRTAEFVSLPITLAVLVLVFGGLVAAGLPVLAAVASVAAAMVVMLGFTTVTDVDSDGVTVVTLLGLGLSIDYGLLLVARYREELLGGHPPEVSIARAWATAGRTILFSALTVAAALSGLLMFDLPTLTALGAAGVSIAVVSMLVSLTLTAALIGALQRWIRPSKHRRRPEVAAQVRRALGGPGAPATSDSADRGGFAWLSGLVQRRALLVAVLTGAGLVAAGIPLLTSQIKLPGINGIPRTVEAARVADVVSARFEQPSAPAITVVARTDRTALDVWADQWRFDPTVARIRPAKSIGLDARDPLSTVAFDLVGDRQGKQARALVADLRDNRPALQSWVTGDAAVLTDLLGLIGAGLPLAAVVTLLAMMVLLFAMTGSLVVPAKAILANLVSLGATFGLMTAVFEYGFGSDLLDTLTVGALNPFVVVVVFAFAFGLSMDYEVFLLARIKEYVDAGVDTETAVRRGLQHSGRVITSAALLMVIVFGCFAAARSGSVEQIGFGLAVAVLIDATIVRCLLVPATMTLLGQWNWWAPARLRRLHERIGLREHPLLPAAEVRPGRGALLAAAAAGVQSPLARTVAPTVAPAPSPAWDAPEPPPAPTAAPNPGTAELPPAWGTIPESWAGNDPARPPFTRWVRLGRNRPL